MHAQPNPYRLVEGWANLPPGFEWGEVGDASFDSRGHLWVVHRRTTPGAPGALVPPRGGDGPILEFDKSGTLIRKFGEGLFLQPHGLYVDRDDNIWITDCGKYFDVQLIPGKGYQVFKFNRDGKLLLTLGTGGVSKPGRDSFLGPTDVVVNDKGEIFVSDGHTPRPDPQNGDRIVKFSKDGKFLKEFGLHGSEPGQTYGPHRLALDSRGRLFVADRGNRRIQIFDREGPFIDQWKQFGTPSGLWIDTNDVLYVAVSSPADQGGVKIGSARDGSLAAWVRGTSPEVVAVNAEGHIYAGLSILQRMEKYVKR